MGLTSGAQPSVHLPAPRRVLTPGRIRAIHAMVHARATRRRQPWRCSVAVLCAVVMSCLVCDAAPLRALAPVPGPPAAPEASSSAAAALVAKCREVATPAFAPVCSASNVTLLNAAWAACVDGHPTSPGACVPSPGDLEHINQCTLQKCAAEPFAMVCGVDGQSYANACVAACAGLGWVRGECCACPECPVCRQSARPDSLVSHTPGPHNSRASTTNTSS